jgi:hypothetical protein
MTRRKRQDLAPSLFPFLAVLVCTLGTLILLLALVSQNTATAAEEQARKDLSQEPDNITANREMLSQSQAIAMIDEAGFHIDTIESIRDRQAAALEQRRDQLTHLEDHIQRLKKQLQRLNSEIQLANTDGETMDVDAASLVLLRDQIQQEELEIEQLREETKNETPRVVIVPHKGPNGTTRRPIYIECTPEGLIIWPEGVKIKTEQLENRRTRIANPLDAALRVARLHVMKVYRDADPPYPLLVVRPHGTDAYFQATAAMQDWDDQYGYEMLDDDIELAFGAPDPNLKRRMEESIRQALARQVDRRTSRAVTLSASKLSRDGQSRGFRERPDHGYYGNSSSSSRNSSDIARQATRLDDIYRDAAEELRARDGSVDSIGNPGGKATNQSREPFGRQQDNPYDSDEAETDVSNYAGSGGKNSRQAAPNLASTNPANSDQTGSNSVNEQGNPSESCEACEESDHRATDRNGDFSSVSPSAKIPNSLTPPDSTQIPEATMVHRDGENWALPSRVANARGIAIVRTIRVQFYEDRFVVPATRGETVKVIPIRGNLDRATLQLATVLRDRIGRWGAALDNGRWEPKLEVEVMNGAGSQLDQLKTYLKGSGIEVNGGSAR